MDRRALACVALLIASLAPTAAADEEDVPVVLTEVGRQVFRDVRAWYRDQNLALPYRQALAALGAGGEDRRRWGGEYLHALFLQTVSDERLGRTPPSSGYKLYGGPQDDGAKLRWDAARELADARLVAPGREALAAALFLFREDPWTPSQVPGMRTLAKIDAPEAVTVIHEAVTAPHPSFEVLQLAIQETARRRIEGLDDALRRLCGHYHPGVRGPARDAARALGLQGIAEYAPASAFTPALERGLRDLAEMVFDPVPPEAPWRKCIVTTPAWDPGDPPWIREVHGFLTPTAAAGEHRVLSCKGTLQLLPVAATQVQEETLAGFASELVDLRTRYLEEKDEALHERLTALVGQERFMRTHGNWDPTLAEGLVAAWSLVRGDRETAALVLFPLLEHTGNETALLEEFGRMLASQIDRRMLETFVEGDYAGALPLARHLARPLFDRWEHQDRARDLLEQLPRRMETDFRTLTLPTPTEWKALSGPLSRLERIRFLAARLRLIRAEQRDIPGGVSYGESQFRAGEGPDGKAVQIETLNPYSELYSMNLAAKELPLLFDVLMSADYIRAFDLQRFLPNDPINLYRARWLAASLADTVAQRDLIDHKILEGGDSARLRAHLDEVRAWCEKEGDVTLGNRLEKAVATGTDWDAAKSAAWLLGSLDRPALARAVEVRLASDEAHRVDLLKVAAHVGAAGAVPVARAFLAGPPRVGVGWAALLLVKHGDRAKREGIDVLLATLAQKDIPALLNDSVDPLLDTRDASALAFLRSLLVRNLPVHATMLVIQRLFLKGQVEARDFLLDALAGKQPFSVYQAWPWMSGGFETVSSPESFQYEIGRWSDSVPRAAVEEFFQDRNDVLEATRGWLRAEFERIQAGKPSRIEPTPPAEPYVEWSGSGRWIRRL